ncbi:C4-dicarboxylate ABC transporter substrate-binding protein [Achromobacter sp. RTa]|uniref:TRAP transporter substrate-binding protein n=1 Tax=Achromobacter sp. RTa TaxID=1532557 RepID=UPI0005102C3D|nr:DctP family TRAP transporter solute-binding subunit [Achromobacter sp. RTa]KGD86790.1 C4-dicarboxylate ABC transporter substrate-binding protein [Achromobacter sp. RTa]
MTTAPQKKQTLLAAALLALAGLAPLSAHALDIKLGHVLAPNHSWNKAAEGFAAEVKEKTAGRVNFVLFPSGQLGNEKTMLEGLQIGSQGAAIIGSGSLQPIEPKFGVVELPYTWSSSAQAYKAYDGELGAALAKLADKKNLVIVSWWENGFRHVTNNRGPVAKPADLAGLKTRVTPDKMRLDTFTALGANPAPLAFGELYSALQQKVFDAQENPLSIIYTSSFFEVQKYLSLTGHVWGPANLIISKPIWNRLSAEDRQVVQAAADKWRDAQRKMISDGDQQFIAQLKEKGMQVNEVDKTAFAAAVEPVWKTYSATYGPELMALVQKYREAK